MRKTASRRILGESTEPNTPRVSYDIDDKPVAVANVKEVPKSFFKYTVSGPQFRPVGDVILTDNLTPGAYKIGHDMSGMFLEQIQPNTDEMMVFEDSPMHKAVNEIATFWDRKEHYNKLGLMQSRGMLGADQSRCARDVPKAVP